MSDYPTQSYEILARAVAAQTDEEIKLRAALAISAKLANADNFDRAKFFEMGLTNEVTRAKAYMLAG